jgi:hypothetical protein
MQDQLAGVEKLKCKKCGAERLEGVYITKKQGENIEYFYVCTPPCNMTNYGFFPGTENVQIGQL